MKMQAIWNGQVIAESEHTIHLEGNHYFPVDTLQKKYFKSSDHQSQCPWKGTASYYDIEVDGEINRAAAWYYPEPSRMAALIKDHVAFWNGVKVLEMDE